MATNFMSPISVTTDTRGAYAATAVVANELTLTVPAVKLPPVAEGYMREFCFSFTAVSGTDPVITIAGAVIGTVVGVTSGVPYVLHGRIFGTVAGATCSWVLTPGGGGSSFMSSINELTSGVCTAMSAGSHNIALNGVALDSADTTARGVCLA